MKTRVTAPRPAHDRSAQKSATGRDGSTSLWSAFEVPSFGFVWFSGLIWHLCRWGILFLGTYLVEDLTGSPRLVQLAGTVLYAPLLVGGLLGGLISDKLERLRTVRVQLLVLVPLTVLIGVLVRADAIQVWMIYLYLFAGGIGWITDMTSRRALIFDLVGPGRLNNAMALESLSLSSGMVMGALVGGSAIQAVGVGSAYFFIAGFLALAFVSLIPVRTPQQTASRADDGERSLNPVQELVAGVRQLRSNRGVISILGVTAIANFFLFAYFPIVPVMAERLNASASRAGLLLAGTGIGMMIGSALMARIDPYRRGLAYVTGVFAAIAMIVPFALADRYPVALAFLVASGIGSGFFGSTQSALIIAEAPPDLRGRALGLLSMAIGALPVGMYVLGEEAERWGAPQALVAHALTGAVILAFWLSRRREVLSMTT